MTKTFPNGFIWGAATAAHQVEGDNDNSDIWVEESVPGSPYKEPSGTAIDHWNRFKDDISLLASLGLKAYRFSIEWARIEPEPGVWSEAALAHYVEVCDTCHQHGLEPIVTLHHFSSPKWLTRFGGWRGSETPRLFERYVEHVMAAIGTRVRHVVTMNECNISILIGEALANLLRGAPPELVARFKSSSWKKVAAEQCGGTEETHCSFMSARDAQGAEVIKAAHVAARAAIRRLAPQVKVGFSLALQETQAMPGGEAKALESWHFNFRQWLPIAKDDDFLGVQVYTRVAYQADGSYYKVPGAKTTQMQSEFAPEALASVLRDVSREFGKPLFVTENGLATSDDRDRVEYITRSLAAVHDCMRDGIPVIGYIHWSAFDNFEWLLGYAMHFGLIAVDRSTQQRTPKPSAEFFGAICRSGSLPAHANAQQLPPAGTPVHLL